MQRRATAVAPLNDLDAAQAFFGRLGFASAGGDYPGYRILADGHGGIVHLAKAAPGWLDPARNPLGLYLRRDDVDEAAAAFAGEIIEKEGPSDKPWGMYEFALNGPDNLLVRIGRPSRGAAS